MKKNTDNRIFWKVRIANIVVIVIGMLLLLLVYESADAVELGEEKGEKSRIDEDTDASLEETGDALIQDAGVRPIRQRPEVVEE
jgi:hypothetical protein